MSDPRPPWWLLTVATAVVAVAKLLLLRLRTTTVLTWLAGSSSRGGRGEGTSHGRRGLDPDMAARSVAAASRLLRADCLPQAVALAALLQRAGTAPEVVLGCRFYGEGRWGAHAWVEQGERKFDPLADEEHAELARLTAAGRWEVRPGTGA